MFKKEKNEFSTIGLEKVQFFVKVSEFKKLEIVS